MNRSLTITASMLVAASPAAAKDKKPTANQPNVIIVLADDLGYGDLSCYGARNVSTPNVDQLAASGLRFTQAHAAAATSTPSRYALLTGMYAWRRPDTDVAAGNAGMIIKPQQFTLADLFHQAGYATAAIGKWHLGLGSESARQDWNKPLDEHLADLGFDYHYIMAATADRVPCVYIENGRVANYDASAPISVSYDRNFEGEPTGKTHPELLFNLRPSHGHDQAIVNGISRIGFMKGGGKALWKDENIADSITQHAISFVRQHRDEPFFLYFCTNDVHVPRFPHERFRGQNPMGLRGDAIVQFDWSVGQLMQELRRLGIEENTLVILTSDNGPVVDDGYDDRAEELLGGHSPAGPFRGHKYSSFEGGTAVPLVVAWPGHVAKGTQTDALFSLVDLMASMAAMTGVELPAEAAPDSHDQLQALLGQRDKGCKYVVEQSTSRVLSVRTPRWKFIEPSQGPKMIPWGAKVETGNLPEPQLYDMRNDTGERHNVAPKRPRLVRKFLRLLRKTRK